jgi:diguanylate cyclase (GGDEF)-like protein
MRRPPRSPSPAHRLQAPCAPALLAAALLALLALLSPPASAHGTPEAKGGVQVEPLPPGGEVRGEGAGEPGAAAPIAPRGYHVFRSYGTEHGLRNLAVYNLEQDAEGFVWVGTEDGLYRYDGQRFERFGHESGLPHDEVSALHVSPDGALWVGTPDGLARWEGGAFRPFGPEAGVPREPHVWQLAGQRDGTLYALTSEGFLVGSAARGFAPLQGLPPLLPEPDTLVPPVGSRRSREPSKVRALWAAAEGPELLALRGAYLMHRRADGTWAQQLVPGEERPGVVARDGRGRVWLRGVRTLLRQASPGAPFEDLSALIPARTATVERLYVDRRDRVWVPSNMGVVVFEGERHWRLGEEEGLPTHWVENVLVDREDSVWVASEGVHRGEGRLLWSVHSRKSGLPSDTVWLVDRDSRGRLWVGTVAGLVEGRADGWHLVPGTEGVPIYSLAEDHRGGLWVGGGLGSRTRGYLLHLPAGASQWREVPLPLLHTGSTAVWALLFDPSSRSLLVAATGQGLHELFLEGEGAPRLEKVALPEAADHKETVEVMLLDRRGRVWAGGPQGLLRREAGRWTRYGTEQGLVENALLSLAEAPDGALLLSYWTEHALSRFEPGPGRAVPYEGPAELTTDSIYSVGYDRRGVLWLGTATGVKRWDGVRLEHYGQGSGLRGQDCSANTRLFERNGDVWMGMSNGLARFHASLERPPPAPPRTVITSLSVGDVAPRAPAAGPLELPSSQRKVGFRVAALGFVNETRVEVEARLAGFEDGWHPLPSREARYAALSPGRYRFEARARMAGGAWGEVVAQELSIAAPWWQTWWGLALLGLAAGSVLAQLFRWRLSYLRRENERLEALVRARTRELEEATLLDPLTGAKNRRFLQLTLPDEVARVLRRWRSAAPGAPPAHGDIVFFMVDLDHFKAVNDTYGHSVGDRVLRQASAVLRSALRETDTLVRWGGEEFLVVAQQTDRAGAEAIAAKLCDAIRSYEFDLGEGQRLRRTCSVGFASFPLLPGAPEALGWEDVVELSDRCLYAAKNSGRDGWVGLTCRKVVVLPTGPLHLSDVLPGMVESRTLELVSSFPAERRLVWR